MNNGEKQNKKGVGGGLAGLPFKLQWVDLWVSWKELPRQRAQQEQRSCKTHSRQLGDHCSWYGVTKKQSDEMGSEGR